MKYYCSCCNFETSHRPNYERHLKTKKHLGKIENNTNNNNEPNENNTNSNNDNTNIKEEKNSFNCKYCDKIFSTRQSRNRHQSKFCKMNDKVPYEKLAMLLNEKEKQLSYKDDEVKACQEKIENLEIQLEKIINQLEIPQNSLPQTGFIGDNNHHNNLTNNTLNQTLNQNNTLNFQLLNYNKTDYDFLTDNDYIKCIQQNNHCVKELIARVHFNKRKPENMNIYISSLKGKYIMVYKNDKWQVQDAKKHIDDLYYTNELYLENWFDEFSEKYPHVIKSFKRYLNNKDESGDDLIDDVKNEIFMMLYNKKDLIKHNTN